MSLNRDDAFLTPPPTPARSAPELATELRREFERMLFERYGQPPGQDPVLATLFHATAVQLARVYAEAEQVFPEAVFDDLVSGLGMPPRAAQPAQTVVHVTGIVTPEPLTDQLPLVGYTPQAERLVFAADLPITLSATTLAFAGMIEDGQLQSLPGATVPGGQGVLVPTRTVPIDAGARAMGPSLLLAFEVGSTHLGELGLFIDTEHGSHPVARALARAAWQLLDADGVAHEWGVLRSHAAAGAVRQLRWSRAAPGGRGERAADMGATLLDGPYGPLCWVFPAVPEERRVVGRPPQAIEAALARLLPPEHASAYTRPLAWVQVQVPAESRAGAAIRRVAVNCVTASNLEVQADRIVLGSVGEPVSQLVGSATDRHLVHVLGVVGEQGASYERVDEAEGELAPGAYRVRGSVLGVCPVRGPTGRFDRLVTVWCRQTAGARANAIEPGDVRQFGAPTVNPTAQVVNLTAARGGAAPPPAAPARVRFAELVRTRERVITPADLAITTRAYEPRVRDTRVHASIEAGPDGSPRRVEIVTARVHAADFDDPAADFVRLAAGLERHLHERTALATPIRVQVEALDVRRGARS